MAYSTANRLVSFNGTEISYDADGNMLNTPLGDDWGSLTYNSLNYLTDVVTSDGAILFEYDAENNRTLKNEYGKSTSYVVNPNTNLSRVLMSTTDSETTYYIYGLGLIAQETSDDYKTYHYDYRGSTTAITDENGNVTDRVYYDPYGSIINRTGTTDTPFLYVGKYGVETDDSGLYYMRARYYNPTIQRFINVDPIRDGYNWYGYTNNNPIIFIDPFGLDDVIIYTGNFVYEEKPNLNNYNNIINWINDYKKWEEDTNAKNKSDWTKQATWMKNKLESQGRKVRFISVNSRATFEEAWNGLGHTPNEDYEIDDVYIYSHGSERSLFFLEESSTEAISINGKNLKGDLIGDINQLQNKDIENLYLYSCNAGNLNQYYYGTVEGKGVGNVASIFSKKVSGFVIAYDGNISFGKNSLLADLMNDYKPKLSSKQESFYENCKYYQIENCKPKGSVLYHGGFLISDTFFPHTTIEAAKYYRRFFYDFK